MAKTMHRILGIDPGTANTGFGIIEVSLSKVEKIIDYGVITTQSNAPESERLSVINSNLEKLILNHQPNIIAVEKLFFFRNTTTIITVAQARGVILLTAQLNNIPIFEFTPLQIKQAITGYGKAPKKQMQQMVATILGLKSIPKPDDAADGLAIALCCQSSLGYLLKT